MPHRRKKRWGRFCIDDVVPGSNFLWQAFVGLWGGGRQTDRLSKLKTGQILELSRSWGVGVFYKFPKFLVVALWQCCVLCCCVLFCVLLLQVVLLVVLVGKSRSAGGAPHYFLPSPPSTWSLSSSSSPPCYGLKITSQERRTVQIYLNWGRGVSPSFHRESSVI